ncbi:uncharacterized protein LOC117323519 [Pecten maximus]|uniref:uncharacterized protein LOC117323519 n=1 Tax=Pecten maximus TaxID=6579 RepID=UPI0014590CCA|nr:uncharacterized protein LOC117323519 [Pecten maximus]
MYRHITVSLLLIFMLKVTLAFWVTETTTAPTVSKHQPIRQRNQKQAFVTNFDNQKHETVQTRKQRSPYRLPISNAMSHLLGYSGNSGIENSTHITRGNKTCRKISCTENHFVRSCDEDGGNDTCVPCAAGTFLLDNTSSMQHNHECVTAPPCYPEATPSQNPNFCGDHRTFCKCDLSRNFCGHDPCNCNVGHCSSVSAPVLNINCGCDRLSTTAKIPSILTTPQPTHMETTTFENTTISSVTPSNSSTMYTSSEISKQTMTMTTTRTTTTTEQPKNDQTCTGISGGGIAVICLVVFALGVVVGGVGIYNREKIIQVLPCKSKDSTSGEAVSFVHTAANTEG